MRGIPRGVPLITATQVQYAGTTPEQLGVRLAEFVDRAVLKVKAGDGGNGSVSVLREKFRPLGGPDGGNGGRGGSVIIRADEQEGTLLDYHHRPHQKADAGTAGAGDMRHGKNADDLVLLVPVGTVVKSRKGEVLADLSAPGAEMTLAKGGRGGLGNAALANRTRKAPGFALLGEPGEEATATLELKSIADVALVGYPSSGKSSLIAAMSKARPKIADYPFTTLVPNLGVVQAGEERYTVADVPGLIPGASEGKGLGLEFLRHIERCSVIAHVIDTDSLEVERDPLSDLDVIEEELQAYSADLGAPEGYVPLTERPRAVILNKVDMPDGAFLASMVRPQLEERGYQVFETSAITGEGLKELTFGLAQIVEEERKNKPKVEAAPPVVTVRSVGSKEKVKVRRVRYDGEVVFQVRGDKPELWVRQTDFGNDEAVGFLADRLAGFGVEDELAKAGALPGDPVVIGALKGGVIFEWEPTASVGVEPWGARGQDARLSESERPSRRERKQTFHDRMDAKEAARQELRDEAAQDIWTDAGKA